MEAYAGFMKKKIGPTAIYGVGLGFSDNIPTLEKQMEKEHGK